MGLFVQQDFIMHSGGMGKWKIECDALTDDDINTLALIIREIIPDYNSVVGIPNGGIRLETALKKLVYPQPTFSDSQRLLIVDDVLTTGNSMNHTYEMHNLVGGHEYIKGAVIFARGKTPDWITPLFQMPDEFY